MGSGYGYKASFPDRWVEIGRFAGVPIVKSKKSGYGAPTYSKTSDAYLTINKRGELVRMRTFGEKNANGVRVPVMDIDFGQDSAHVNPDGTKFEAFTIHVHEFHNIADKKSGRARWVRSSTARTLTTEEMAKYGEVIRKMMERRRG